MWTARGEKEMLWGVREINDVSQTGEQTSAWDVVAERLEAFVAAWEAGSAPAIAARLPAGPPALRRLVLVELVKVDIEFRCGAGGQPRIEEYVAAFPELDAGDGPPVELLCEEYHVRKARGESVELAEFGRRFPGRAAEMWRWFGGVERTMTTSLAAAAGWEGFRSGETVDDFLVLAEAGKGAFATVYLARQISMGRIVALKVSSDRGDEARTLAQLDHPHIVRVHDQKRLEAAAGRPPMRLMYEQFLPGGTLADVVQRVRRTAPPDRDGRILADAVRAATAGSGLELAADSPALAAVARLSWPAAVARIGIQLAGALHHAHAAGVLHRDVKPANVLLGAEGSAHLGDFNTSVLASHPAHGPAAYFGGSLAYMSPEHLEAFDSRHERSPEDLDGRADLFSLAVLLVEVLTGARPFHDQPTAGDVAAALADMRARRLAEAIKIDADPTDREAAALATLLRQCLCADRAARPASGAELAHQLALVGRPRALGLLAEPGGGWRRFARRHPFAAALVCMIVPNLVLAVANNLHQRRILAIFAAGPDPTADPVATARAFDFAIGGVNLVAFPLGILIGWRLIAPIVAAVHGRIAGRPAAVAVRHGSLVFADRMTWIAVTLWIACGIGGAVLFAAQAGLPPVPVRLMFLQSSLVCGLMAAAYTFFLVTLLVLRAIYPALLGRTAAPEDAPKLAAVGSRSGWYLLMAGGGPLVTMAVMFILGSEDRPALALLTFAGLAGLASSFWAYREIAADAAALIAASSPADEWSAP